MSDAEAPYSSNNSSNNITNSAHHFRGHHGHHHRHKTPHHKRGGGNHRQKHRNYGIYDLFDALKENHLLGKTPLSCLPQSLKEVTNKVGLDYNTVSSQVSSFDLGVYGTSLRKAGYRFYDKEPYETTLIVGAALQGEKEGNFRKYIDKFTNDAGNTKNNLINANHDFIKLYKALGQPVKGVISISSREFGIEKTFFSFDSHH